MPDDPLRRDRPAAENVGKKPLQRRELRFGERVVARVVQLDPDRARVDVRDLAPVPGAGMPGPLRLVDQLVERSVRGDQVVRGDLRLRVAQPVERRRAVAHRREVQHHEVGRGPAAAGAVIGRGVADHPLMERKALGFQAQA